MNFTLAHLKIAYLMGTRMAPFEEVSETIAMLERNGILDVNGNWASDIVNAQVPKAFLAESTAANSEKRRRLPRGGLTKRIVAYLQNKGAEGARVKDIAEALGSSRSNVRIWFYRTGGDLIKAGDIKKIGTARYAFVGRVTS